jgi:hypothetical protein
MSLNKAITEFFANLTKESAEEAGGIVADRIRFWRIKQALSLKEKLDIHLKQRGITDTREVPLKLTVAVLDGATIEDDDELHSEWAKLLANAVDPGFEAEVRVAYTDILRSMNAFDAKLLHEIYAVAVKEKDGEKSIHEVHVNVIEIANRIGANKPTTELSRDCLIRQRCIELAPKMHQPGQHITHDGGAVKWVTPPAQQVGVYEHAVFVTELGEAFVKACT